MTAEPTDEWLSAANLRYREADVPPRQRPWRAWTDYADEQRIALELRDRRVTRIFDWFKEHTQEGSHRTGPLYQGAFYFDACFWALDVPVVYGTVTLDLFASLTTMPVGLKQALARDPGAMEQLLITWTSCIDYGLGFDDLLKEGTTGIAGDFLQSGHRELCSCVGLLLAPRPNAKAAHTASFAIELVAKWLLATKEGLDSEGAKKLGHNLERLLERCSPYVPNAELAAHIERARLMPAIGARYEGAEPPPRYLWEAYLTAQTIVATLTRVVTGRDSQPTLRIRASEGPTA